MRAINNLIAVVLFILISIVSIGSLYFYYQKFNENIKTDQNLVYLPNLYTENSFSILISANFRKYNISEFCLDLLNQNMYVIDIDSLNVSLYSKDKGFIATNLNISRKYCDELLINKPCIICFNLSKYGIDYLNFKDYKLYISIKSKQKNIPLKFNLEPEEIRNISSCNYGNLGKIARLRKSYYLCIFDTNSRKYTWKKITGENLQNLVKIYYCDSCSTCNQTLNSIDNDAYNIVVLTSNLTISSTCIDLKRNSISDFSNIVFDLNKMNISYDGGYLLNATNIKDLTVVGSLDPQVDQGKSILNNSIVYFLSYSDFIGTCLLTEEYCKNLYGSYAYLDPIICSCNCNITNDFCINLNENYTKTNCDCLCKYNDAICTSNYGPYYVLSPEYCSCDVWLKGFKYREKLNIFNPNSTLFNVEVPIYLDTASLISEGKMNASCNDLRFLGRKAYYKVEITSNYSIQDYQIKIPLNLSENETLAVKYSLDSNDYLPYAYVEDGLWIKLNLTNGTNYIYIIPDMNAPKPNPYSVFDIYDDFNDGIFNDSLWYLRGPISSWKETAGILTVYGDTNNYDVGIISKKTFLIRDYIFEGRIKSTTTSVDNDLYICFTYSDNPNIQFWYEESVDNPSLILGDPSQDPSTTHSSIRKDFEGGSSEEEVVFPIYKTISTTWTFYRAHFSDNGYSFGYLLDKERNLEDFVDTNYTLDNNIYHYAVATNSWNKGGFSLDWIRARKYLPKEPDVNVELIVSNYTELNYYIESGCNTNSTLIWVKVPYLKENSNTSIYLFYGNFSVNSNASLSAFGYVLDNLMLAYHFDKEGSTVKDYSGNNFTGTIYGAIFVNGYYGKALSFDGVDDYVLISKDPKLDLKYNSTSLIARFNTKSNYYEGKIINKGLSSAFPVRDGYSLRFYNETGGYRTSFNDGSTYYHITTSDKDVVSINTWHLGVGVLDRNINEIHLYLDNYLVGNSSFSLGDISNPYAYLTIGNLYRGSYGDNTEWFNGTIDEVFILYKAIDDKEVYLLNTYYPYANFTIPHKLFLIHPEYKYFKIYREG